MVKHDSKNDNYIGRVRFQIDPREFLVLTGTAIACELDHKKTPALDVWREFCAVFFVTIIGAVNEKEKLHIG